MYNHTSKRVAARYSLLLYFIILAFQMGACSGIAAESSKLGVFYVPCAMQIKHGTDGQLYPIYVNRFSDCLPGKLYDVRELFTPHGAAFGKGDFALFNPEGKILVVRAAKDDFDMIDVFVSSIIYDPPLNVVMAGHIRVEGNKARDEARWRFSTQSGQRCAISAKKGNALGYSMEIEPILSADSENIDCRMNLQVYYQDREYAAQTGFSVLVGKPYSIIIGTTPHKEQILFEFTPTVECVDQPSPFYTPKGKEKKERLIKCISKHLEN